MAKQTFIPKEFLDSDNFEELETEIIKELETLVSDPLGKQKPPPNAPATIKRKKSSIPLEDTGYLKKNFEVRREPEGIVVYAPKYYFYQTSKYFGKLFNIGEVMKKLVSAFNKWKV